MSNTTSIGDRAICEELSCVQLGSVSKPVETAYINNVIPTPAANLQEVCNVGNTTSTDIISSLGSFKAPIGLFQGAGVDSTADITSTTDIVANQNLTATNGDITATGGNITCVSGTTSSVDIVASNRITGTNQITCTTGDITANTGDLVATTGGCRAGEGFSLLNRIQFKTYYGGTTATAPLAVAPQGITPLRVFTMPNPVGTTFQLTVFLTNSQINAQEFAFEVHNLPRFCLRDYQLHMTAQTYRNGGGFSLGFNGIVIGEAISDPTNTSKCTCIFNTAQPYAAQQIKCNVRFEYSPSP